MLLRNEGKVFTPVENRRQSKDSGLAWARIEFYENCYLPGIRPVQNCQGHPEFQEAEGWGLLKGKKSPGGSKMYQGTPGYNQEAGLDRQWFEADGPGWRPQWLLNSVQPPETPQHAEQICCFGPPDRENEEEKDHVLQGLQRLGLWQWEKVMYSGESNIQVHQVHQVLGAEALGLQGSNWYDSQYTVKSFKHLDQVMAWGCFSGAAGSGELFFLHKNTSLIGKRYQAVQENPLLPFMEVHSSTHPAIP
jgi:hypothetical protein